MKRILVLAVLAVVIVVALAACIEEELDYWDNFIFGGSSTLDSTFDSPIVEPAPPRVPPPTATPVCFPKLETKNGIMKLEWNCQ